MGRNRTKLAAGNQATRKGWTTDEQYEYLMSQIPAFVKAQSSKTTANVWPGIHEEWFKRWPFGPPTKEDIARNLSEDDRVKAVKMVSDTYYLFYPMQLTIVPTEGERLVKQLHTCIVNC